jgi:anti-sigma regulatory factor (Ser/Thr protein kinase)
MTAVSHEHHAQDFRHEAFFYAGQEEFLAGMVPFIQGAVAAGEPMLVVVNAEKIRMLKAHLNGQSDGVLFEDMAEVGQNPARIIPAWHRFVDEHAEGGRRVRGIGEPIWPERTPDEMVECVSHESLLNLAFDGVAPMWLVCPYDTEGLDGDILESARRNHPFLSANGAEMRSDAYLAPYRAPGPFDGELAPAAAEPDEVTFADEHLAGLRGFVTRLATEAGLSEQRGADLTLAVSELAANSVRHAGGNGTVRIWQQDGKLLAEVCDAGRIDKPLVGRANPSVDQPSGRGLWLVNHLCDLVQIRSNPSGNVVRVHMSLA